jgi:hypothetical protein
MRFPLFLCALLALAAPATAAGQAPRAEAPPQTGPISGYMELHLNKPVDDSGEPPILDFHRFVLLFNHRFSDRLRFVGELELEHALVEGLEEKGELELEQAYIDMLFSPAFNVRAGMLLVPVGIINERHEPPVFHGVERPFVDTVIVPTTWFEVGAGVHGELGGKVRYRAYAMAPLDSAEFSADEGLRGGIQKGSESQVRNVAWTGRLEYIGTPGLQIGTSFWRGDSSVTLPRTDTKVGMFEMDARYRRQRFEGRAQYAHVFIGNADVLNDALARLIGVDPNIASQLRGFYVEGAYRVLPQRFPHDLAFFARYENFDTQYRMPAGYVKLPEFDRDAFVVGATYWLDPDVAIKMDYSHVRSGSSVIPPPRTFNVGLGWWF